VTRALGNKLASMVYRKSLASALQKGLCSPETLEEGLTVTASSLDIMERTSSSAYDNMAKLLKAIGLDSDKERVTWIASCVKDSEKLIQLTLW